MTEFIADMTHAMLDAVIHAGRPSSMHGLDRVYDHLVARVRRELGV
ncbi:MAG TPA: hypothetical protein VK196_22615 [Magnetospirillum sp.]|nr:hypothetical protein [Magnetospirillum sp.]